ERRVGRVEHPLGIGGRIQVCVGQTAPGPHARRVERRDREITFRRHRGESTLDRVRFAVLVGLVACGSSPPAATPLSSDGTHLRDDKGRIALLRGVNARIAGVFDVTFTDGRAPLEAIPALAPQDCARMRALGLDFLRLPINWSAIEPTQGSYD